MAEPQIAAGNTVTVTAEDTRPPIPASLMHRPVHGGLAVPFVNVRLADGGADFRTAHRSRAEACWRQCLCQSCGRPAWPHAVLVCGPRQLLSGRFDEPPACPPCALYASRACPMVAGRMPSYADRPRVSEGHRGERCAEPGCDCAGWVNIDPEHTSDASGQPAHPWYAAWFRPHAWTLTGHQVTVRCSDRGCEHERLMIDGAQADGPPLKVLLISEPGRGRIWQPLSADQAQEHAARAAEGMAP